MKIYNPGLTKMDAASQRLMFPSPSPENVLPSQKRSVLLSKRDRPKTFLFKNYSTWCSISTVAARSSIQCTKIQDCKLLYVKLVKCKSVHLMPQKKQIENKERKVTGKLFVFLKKCNCASWFKIFLLVLLCNKFFFDGKCNSLASKQF